MAEHISEPARGQTIDLPAGRFHFWSWGAERTELPPAVLLHGITSSALSWVRVAPALAGRFRVYALDMRGHGDSVHPAPGAYGLRQSADDAAAFIAALGLHRPLLIGHSWGGATAIVLASGAFSQAEPPRFSHVILEDPASDFGVGDPEKRAAFYVMDIGRSPDEVRPELIANNPGWTAEDIEGKIDALQKISSATIVSVFADAGRDGDILPYLGRISDPVLLVRADENLGTTLNAEKYQRACAFLSPQSMAVEIKGASHNVHRSKFSAFMDAVNAFLDKHPG